MAIHRTDDPVLDLLARSHHETEQELARLKEWYEQEKERFQDLLDDRKRDIDSHLGEHPPVGTRQTLITARGYRVNREVNPVTVIPPGKNDTAVRALERLGLDDCIEVKVSKAVRKDVVKSHRGEIGRLRSVKVIDKLSVNVKPPKS